MSCRGRRDTNALRRRLAAAAAYATKSIAGDALKRPRVQQYKTLERACEADFDYLMADDAIADIQWLSAPFDAFVRGAVTDALRLNAPR